MIISEHAQGTPGWFADRAGIPTMSSIDKIITSTGKPSAQSEGYMNTLLAEWMTGAKQSIKQTEWMARGVELEPEARLAYEIMSGNEVQEVGFCFKDDSKLVGCSPDGLIGDDGMLEIKCPAPGTHVGYMLKAKLPTTYVQQVQGQLWVAGREWADFVSYSPDMDSVIIRVEKDEKFHEALDELIGKFINTMLEKREQLTKARKAA